MPFTQFVASTSRFWAIHISADHVLDEQVVFDNLTFGPILNAAYMLFTAAVLEGESIWGLAKLLSSS